MKRLMNIRHTFDLEVGNVGVTIRKGEKWSKIPIGTLLELMNCTQGHKNTCEENGCSCEGYGKVLGHWVGEFQKLPLNLLSIEHNNKAKDMTILKEMMKIGYGSIEDTDIITALIYERITT